MDKFKNWQKIEGAMNLAIGCMREKREAMVWKDAPEEQIEKLDNAIRILQRVTEASK